jgi:membrane protein DedA with SNARE-associated domain
LLFAGATLGRNWVKMDEYLQLYGKVLLIILAVAVAGIVAYRFWKKRAATTR